MNIALFYLKYSFTQCSDLNDKKEIKMVPKTLKSNYILYKSNNLIVYYN